MPVDPLELKKGLVDASVYLFVRNSSVTTGAGLPGLAYDSSGLTCYYVRPLGPVTQLTLATQTATGAHADGGFVELSSSAMPGAYRLDLADAIVATGVSSAMVMLQGATNMTPSVLAIRLVDDPLGPGADPVTQRIADDSTGIAIADADVWLSSDSGGSTVITETQQTNSDGETTFYLDDGSTYYLWMVKDGQRSITGREFVAVKD